MKKKKPEITLTQISGNSCGPPLSKSENRLFSFLQVLGEICKLLWGKQTRKTSLWVHRVWDLEEERRRRIGLAPGLRGASLLVTLLWPGPQQVLSLGCFSQQGGRQRPLTEHSPGTWHGSSHLIFLFELITRDEVIAPSST